MRNAIAQRRARALRNDTTDAERHLWRFLRLRQLGDHRFRRQVPIGDYIADFVCLEAKLVIELDGGQHGERREEDALRDRFIQQQGFRVLRFWNNQVLQETNVVLEEVLRALEAAPSLTLPRAARKGGKVFPPPLAGEGQGGGSGNEG